MKIQTAILTVALLTTTAFAGSAFAQTPAAAPVATAAPASESGAKDTSKEPMHGGDATQLSPEKAKMYNDAMQPAVEANKELRPQIRKTYEELDAILTAEKFDKAAFLAKTAELDQLYAKSRARLNEAFVSAAEKLSQDDRKLLLKARNERRRQSPQ